jgi:chromosomal replication initiation ATPase DnaA
MRSAWWDKDTEREGDVFVREIIAEVADEFLIFPSDIIAHKNRPKYTIARHKAMWRARHETSSSYLKLARIFKRDHSTVIYGVKCWEARLNGTQYKRTKRSSGADNSNNRSSTGA